MPKIWRLYLVYTTTLNSQVIKKVIQRILYIYIKALTLDKTEWSDDIIDFDLFHTL